MPPLVGGMERLNWHLARELARTAQVRVIAPAGAAALAPADVTVFEVPLYPLWSFLTQATWLACQQTRAQPPNLVIAGSGLTALPVWIAARLAGASAATYVHGLDVAVHHWLYRAVWLSALRRMDCVIANSGPTAELAVVAGVPRARIGIVHPGVELPGTPADPGSIERFRAEHRLGSRPVLLSVGRLTARKGLSEFVTQAMPRILAAQPDAVLLIVGDVPLNALHAEGDTPDSIRLAAQRAGIAPESLRFLGTVTDYAKLGVIYRAANVHVFPVREVPGDPEGFGMVAVEAAAHGLPTVAFEVGGVVDAVSHGNSGRLVAKGDYPAFARAVIDTLGVGSGWAEATLMFAERFSWPKFGQRVHTLLLDEPAE